MKADLNLSHAQRTNDIAHSHRSSLNAAKRVDELAIPVYRRRGEEIHGSDCPDDYWYRVVAGGARCYVVLPGGRRQIIDLLFPNDFFGFTGNTGDFYAVDAVVDDTLVACYPRDALQGLAASDPAVAKEVSEMAFKSMERLQQLVLMLGRTTAREKVGAFLLRMMPRVGRDNRSQIVLLTSRYDIADYLALSVETVSRTLTDLQHRGLITLSGPRRIRIVDVRGLDSQRKPGDSPATN